MIMPHETLKLFPLLLINLTLLAILGSHGIRLPSRFGRGEVVDKELLETRNRDGILPRFPLEPDLRKLSSNIVKSHEVLRKALRQYLDLEDMDLSSYLNHLTFQRTDPFIDEYGQIIHAYQRVFRFIWKQHNETLVHNYAIHQFDKDKLDLCSVARFLSHQKSVENHKTIMKMMGESLGYRCHPCTPYKRKEYGPTIIPNTEDISPDGVTPEESLILCKENKKPIIQESNNSSTETTEKTTVTTIDPATIIPLPSDSLQNISAYEILRNGLQQFLGFEDMDLSIYLNHLIFKRTEPFVDEYGQVITAYHRVFRFIWEQYNETLIQNHEAVEFDKYKLDMCSVARYLSHQPSVKNRNTIMKRMGDSLGYRCHPCTPYKRKEYGPTIVPDTDDINPEGVSPEESLVLCKQLNLPVSESSTVSALDFSIPQIPSFDFNPCEYSRGTVVCDRVSIEEIYTVFRKTSPITLDLIQLILGSDSNKLIPADIFGNKRTDALRIQYLSFESGIPEHYLDLKVDLNAFRFTQNFTNKLVLAALDCSELNFKFISRFIQLSNLTLLNIDNIHICFQSISEFPQTLTHLQINSPKGMNKISSLPVLKNGLIRALFWGVPKNDFTREKWNVETMEKVLNWILLSSADTIKYFAFGRMELLAHVPNQILSFKSMCSLWMKYNKISTIKTGAFSFKVPVCFLDLLDNNITHIESGAFEGDFKDARVSLHGNKLTTFEESVFGSMLKQMTEGKGFIKATQNPIDCSDDEICHLAWLRRFKVDDKFFLNCSNGTSFKDLSASILNNCVASKDQVND